MSAPLELPVGEETHVLGETGAIDGSLARSDCLASAAS